LYASGRPTGFIQRYSNRNRCFCPANSSDHRSYRRAVRLVNKYKILGLRRNLWVSCSVFRRVSVPLPHSLTASPKQQTLWLALRAPCLRAFQAIEPTEHARGREQIRPATGIYRVPPGEKNWLRKKDETGSLANITETTVNHGFGEVQDAHSSQKSPTNSPDGAQKSRELRRACMRAACCWRSRAVGPRR
jgi:hypothetical protein